MELVKKILRGLIAFADFGKRTYRTSDLEEWIGIIAAIIILCILGVVQKIIDKKYEFGLITGLLLAIAITIIIVLIIFGIMILVGWII